jgi:hypothetical protein
MISPRRITVATHPGDPGALNRAKIESMRAYAGIAAPGCGSPALDPADDAHPVIQNVLAAAQANGIQRVKCT